MNNIGCPSCGGEFVCDTICPASAGRRNTMEKLPIEAASDVGKKYELDRVLLIATSRNSDKTYTVSWGKTKEDCGHAAMDIQKLRAVLEAQPTSYKEAIQVARKVRPKDVTGIGG